MIESHGQQANAECAQTQCADRPSKNGDHTESHGRLAKQTMADRSSQGSENLTESHGRMAQQAENTQHPMKLLQSTYPERLQVASMKVVNELLDMLNLYEPPSEPTARQAFEAEIYHKVKRILRNQKQRAYRKAKKTGLA